MKKINNKGVTLVELIVSFALVGVAIIYFFQTLYTVKKVYATARTETNEFINRDYAYRVFDAYFDTHPLLATDNLCENYGLKCNSIKFDNYNNRMSTYIIEWKNGDETKYYKYKGLIVKSNGDVHTSDNCDYACDSNNVLADFHVSNNGGPAQSNISFVLSNDLLDDLRDDGIRGLNHLKIEHNRNCSTLPDDTHSYCSLEINGEEVAGNGEQKIKREHQVAGGDDGFNGVTSINLIHEGKGIYCTCYATVTYFDLK